MRSTTESVPRTKRSYTVKPLQRPGFRGEECEWNSSRDVLSYREAQKNLQRLTKLQNDLYYSDLKIPQLLGPTKECRLFRLPDDIKNFKKITEDLTLLINNIESVNQPVFTKQLPSPHDFTNHPSSMQSLAKLYHIDIRDISDRLTNKKYSSRTEIQSISRKLEKPLLKGRDTSLEWPSKPRKRDGKHNKFGSVSLFT